MGCKPRTLLAFKENFESKLRLDKKSGCWKWTGAFNENGYGMTYWRKLQRDHISSHRVAMYLYGGYPIKITKLGSGLSWDHLCRNRACVNPFHLELVTIKENTMRGVGPASINAKKTSCKRGHEFNEENTGIDKRGSRLCRICRRKSFNKYHTKNKEKRNEQQRLRRKRKKHEDSLSQTEG